MDADVLLQMLNEDFTIQKYQNFSKKKNLPVPQKFTQNPKKNL